MLKHTIAGAAGLLLATTAIAQADVAAQDVWSDWQETYARFGGTLAAQSEEYAGGTLTLQGVTVAGAAGTDDATMALGTVTMAEQPDGTLRIELPAEVEATSTVTQDDLVQTQAMTLSHDGLSIVASEVDGERVYEIAADSIMAALTQQMSLPEGAEPDPDRSMPPTDITFTLSDVASTYRSSVGGEPGAFAQDSTAASGQLVVDVRSETDPLTLTHDMRGLTAAVTGAYGPAPTGPVLGLSDAGITYDGTISHSGSTLTGRGSTEAVTYSLDGTSAGGETVAGMSEDQFTYGVTSTAPEMTFEASNIPVPVEISMAEISSTFALPAGEVGEEKPFGLSVALRDLVASDAVWATFDPTGQIPRDPATLVVDLDGTAVMNVDLLGDPEAMEALEGSPAELKSLNLAELTLTVAGAALRGSGALTFPKPGPDAAPVPGAMPQPVGTIELALDGGNALLDRLVALGVLPAEQVAFVKGMSGAVARTVGDDQLETTIEFTEGGGITANGLPLR